MKRANLVKVFITQANRVAEALFYITQQQHVHNVLFIFREMVAADVTMKLIQVAWLQQFLTAVVLLEIFHLLMLRN